MFQIILNSSSVKKHMVAIFCDWRWIKHLTM